MDLEEQVWSALEEVIDPEVHVNIVDLGLVYRLDVDANRNADIEMTLTVPECPLRDEIVSQVEEAVKAVPDINDVQVKLVWEPRWTPAKMNDQAIEEFRRRHAGV